MGSSGPHAPWRLPENTIESFLCAALADTNVSTVELDVQLTKDNQCVVYHDWYIRPRGLDARPVYDHDAVRAPVYSLTFHQFDALYRQGLQADLCMSEKRIAFRKWAHDKHDIPLSAFDACARTLRQVCDLLPPHISILLELKYPSEDVQEAGLLPYPEMNHYIDLILADLPAHSARKIAFLSFHPDICLMLSLKQTRHPVYFSHCETDDKPCDEFDPRCVDLREGVRFVKAHGVDGIMAYAPLVESKPRIVEDFVADGYPVITYGDRNCDQAHVQAQFDLGVSGVIADDVDVLAAKFGSVAV